MKNFLQFISEAKQSQASERAKKMGLTGDGHGGWYNSAGEFVAKTEGGDLKFYNKGQKPGRDVPPETTIKKPEVVQPQQNISKKDNQSTNKLTVVFGRFNPPTKNHQQLFSTARSISGDSDLKIYPSRTQDSESNPLAPDTKIEFMKKMFPKFSENIVNDEEMISLFDVLQTAENDGYEEIVIVVGSDRLSEFRSLALKHNGDLYNFNDITVVAAGEKQSDFELASKMRAYAANDDFRGFKTGLPKTLDEKDSEKLFKLVKKGIGASTKSEGIEIWKISPKLDYKNLRENYVRGKIFNKGTLVESLNTGLVGKVIRKGTNYLICTTEDTKVMFKSWIYDIKEWTKVSGVSANKREVGTDEYRKYAMKMLDTKKIRNFINKYKEKK